MTNVELTQLWKVCGPRDIRITKWNVRTQFDITSQLKWPDVLGTSALAASTCVWISSRSKIPQSWINSGCQIAKTKLPNIFLIIVIINRRYTWILIKSSQTLFPVMALFVHNWVVCNWIKVEQGEGYLIWFDGMRELVMKLNSVCLYSGMKALNIMTLLSAKPLGKIRANACS